MIKHIKLLFLGNKIISVLLVLGFLANFANLLRVDQFFWDLNVYQTAVNMFNKGSDPYLDWQGLKFVYSPYVLMLFSKFGGQLELFFYIFYFFTFIGFVMSRRGIELLLASFIATPLFMERFLTYALTTGNLTVFAHFLVITLVSFHYPALCLFVVCIITIVKPYFGAYFLLILVVWRKEYWIVGKTFTAFFVTTLIFISQIFVYPNLFNNFIVSLSNQALGDNDLRDVGIGIYRIAAIFQSSGVALVTHCVVWSFIVLSLIFVVKSLKTRMDSQVYEKLIFFTCLIVVTLANPRMKVYDYWIVSAASLVLLYLLNDNFQFLKTKMHKTIFAIFTFLVSVVCSTLNSFDGNIAGVYVPAFAAYILLFFAATSQLSVLHNQFPNSDHSGS